MSELNDMPFSLLEAQHQREMIRIHEAWQQTKAELAEAKAETELKDQELAQLRRDLAAGRRDVLPPVQVQVS